MLEILLLKLYHFPVLTLIEVVPSFPWSSCFLAVEGNIYFRPPALSCYINNRTQIEWAVSRWICKSHIKKYWEGIKGNISE